MASEDHDAKLEEMLRQAAELEARLKSSNGLEARMKVSASSSDGSVQTSESASRTDKSVDDMLKQAELLAAKMRGSDSQVEVPDLYSTPHYSVELDSDASDVDMTRTSPPPEKLTATSTPALISRSERILETIDQGPKQTPTNTTSPDDLKRMNTPELMRMNTPELMNHTGKLLEKMKSKEQTAAAVTPSTLASHEVRAEDLRQAAEDAARAEEMRHLMEQAISCWTHSTEDVDDKQDVLKQVTHMETPSTVTFPRTEADDFSSIGSISPRTRPRNMQFLLNVESVKETDANSGERPSRPPPPPLPKGADPPVETVPVSKPQSKVQSEPLLLPTNVNAKRETKQPDSAKNGVSKNGSPPPRPPPPANKKKSKRPDPNPVTPKAKTRPPQVSSEEAQYRSIMAAIDASPSHDVSWEKVTSASFNDDDYVPLADYSKLSPQKSRAASTSFAPAGRSRRRKLARIIVPIVVVLCLVFVKTWTSRGVTEHVSPLETSKAESVSEIDAGARDDPVPEATVRKARRKENSAVDNTASEEKVEKARRKEKSFVDQKERQQRVQERVKVPVKKVPHSPDKKKVPRSPDKVKVEKGKTTKPKPKPHKKEGAVRQFITDFAMSLTPPAAKFCDASSTEACRDTALLMASLGFS